MRIFYTVLAIFSFVFPLICFAEEPPTTVREISDYQNWGWNTFVMQNGYVTTATVPAIGARVMKYDLTDHSQIYVNSSELGNTYSPGTFGGWPNFGGYKVWPAPQTVWNWPPPPTLDYGAYTCEIVTETDDSVAIFVSSPVEKYTTPNLHLERKMTMYRSTSRIQLKQTIVNEGTTGQEWSVWDITQCIVNHPNENDFENFHVYFPLNPRSIFGSEGIKTSASSSAWKGEIAPGIYCVQFLPENKKIFADAPEGWVAYCDLLEGYTYVKTYPVYTGEDYPDDGANVEVWISSGPLYLEVEVLGPIREIAPNGGRLTFTEDWWAAKVTGPIIYANHVGAINTRLTYNDNELCGIYGVFHVGTAQLVFLDEGGNLLGKGQSHPVTPLATFGLNEKIAIPAEAKRIAIHVFDTQGDLIGTLDEADTGAISAIKHQAINHAVDFSLSPNFPNPFNGSTMIEYNLKQSADVRLSIYNIQGELIRILTKQHLETGKHRSIWDGRDTLGAPVTSGVYYSRIEFKRNGHTTTMSRKMLYVK